MTTFNSGAYLGKTHKEVANTDPQYIIQAYEERHDNGGISNEIYRLAVINLNEQLELESHQGDNIDFSDMDEEAHYHTGE